MRFQSAHLARCEVRDHHDAPPDQLFGRVELGDAGEDLPLAVRAQVHLQPQQLVGLGDALGDDDLRDAQLDLGEVVDPARAIASAENSAGSARNVVAILASHGAISAAGGVSCPLSVVTAGSGPGVSARLPPTGSGPAGSAMVLLRGPAAGWVLAGGAGFCSVSSCEF